MSNGKGNAACDTAITFENGIRNATTDQHMAVTFEDEIRNAASDTAINSEDDVSNA